MLLNEINGRRPHAATAPQDRRRSFFGGVDDSGTECVATGVPGTGVGSLSASEVPPLLVLRVRGAPEIRRQLVLEELDQAGKVHKVRGKTRNGVAQVTQVDEGREGLEGLVLGRRITRSLGALGLLPETRHGGAGTTEGAEGS